MVQRAIVCFPKIAIGKRMGSGIAPCSKYNDPIERVTSREDRATLEASELSNQISMLVRMVRARLLKALEAETLEEAHVKIDDAIDGLDTIIEMTAQAEPQDGQGDGA